MDVGLHIGKFNWTGSPKNIRNTLRNIAQSAEQNSFHSLWLMDHLFQLGSQYGEVHGDLSDPMLEVYTTLGYLSGITSRIKLGSMVTCNLFRDPGLLIKIISTLDVLSCGRSYVGIGTGWFEEEAIGLGLPYPSLKERFEKLEETLQILNQVWKGDESPFEGKYYQLKHPLNRPQPLNKSPPILIGGSGEKKTLRLVAKYGDACNFVIPALSSRTEYGVLARKKPLDETRDLFLSHIHHKLDVLKKHCSEVNRPYDDIEKTIVTYYDPIYDEYDVTYMKDFCVSLVKLGIDHIIINIPTVHEITPLEEIGNKIIPFLADIEKILI